MHSVSTRTETCRVMFIYFQIYGLWYLSLLLMYSIKSLMTGISNIENNWLDVFWYNRNMYYIKHVGHVCLLLHNVYGDFFKCGFKTVLWIHCIFCNNVGRRIIIIKENSLVLLLETGCWSFYFGFIVVLVYYI